MPVKNKAPPSSSQPKTTKFQHYNVTTSSASTSSSSSSSSSSITNITQLRAFCQYIPVRLSTEERALLNVLESTLQVSEYTDNVDVTLRRGNKARRILDGILEACNIATGLAVCGMQDSLPGQAKEKLRQKNGSDSSEKNGSSSSNKRQQCNESLASRDIRDNALFFQNIFEIGRRNKVLNPSRMRDTYGKLMHLLQDAQSQSAARSLGFSLYKELVMVGPFLHDRGLDSLLDDERLVGATVCINDKDEMTGRKWTREEVTARVQQKKALKEELVKEYSAKYCGKYQPCLDVGDNDDDDSESECYPIIVTTEDIQRCIDSICDAMSVVESNLAPVKRMLRLLEEHFDPTQPEKGFSLQLSSSNGAMSSRSSYSNGYSRFGFSPFGYGGGGAKLSHSHSTQYTFVWQSLKLWCEVQKNMHKLWVCADDDLLSTTHGYHLWNTGQGLNRVQSCPRVGKVMRGLLSATQQAAGSAWVGLSVIHLGDRDVPNALVFIDKYTQIPRFLKPIADFIDNVSELCKDQHIHNYIQSQFGCERNLKMTVLADYFKHGFDGSGDDGGSCIDGRLTSSWNWTSQVAKKSYYHVLMLSGFQGFDGDFK
eukprot:CAMPEP_0172507102 /NCGR_PEP_ID=MMETSP1066-20121228/201239_1 /TAXON_ID=671091 /ORGANISM="Coscinodiscus wailesii, Strain CCMP2513" /LENGTH=595 /DNA_ID=CAMNT_0013284495 /DNA_START=64 /DNA_END=1851 /DNA_ORIENTATION=+